jgi:hypothetical protein
MFVAIAVAAAILMLALTFFIRPKDIPQTDPPLPWQHLEARKAAIYENLRDLQFEYRVGKLSDEDYARTKTELQGELAALLAEIDAIKAGASVAPARTPSTPKRAANVCPHCGARFDRNLKFCGECGKPMEVKA